MDVATYAVEAEVEETHWWFVGRRKLFGDELGLEGVPLDARVLDVGTGTGSNLRMLRDLGYTRITGLDASEEAVRHCASKGFGYVRAGDICAMPFADASFDLVLATDVIEHIDDDGRAAAEIARVLAPAGKALITVPAFPSLWGLQDRQAFHKRRYRMGPLLDLLRSAGLRPSRSYHFNFLLFAPIWTARRLIDLAGLSLESENQLNSSLINRILSSIFTLDVNVARYVRAPFGVSILVVAAK